MTWALIVAAACLTCTGVVVVLLWPKGRRVSVKPLQVRKGRCVDGDAHQEFILTNGRQALCICSVCSEPLPAPAWLTCPDCVKACSIAGDWAVRPCPAHREAEAA